MKIFLTSWSVLPGDALFVEMGSDELQNFGTVEICISPAAVPNSRATQQLRASIIDGVARCAIETAHLKCGYYEIAFIKLIPILVLTNPVDELLGMGGTHFPRQIFEVTASKSPITLERLVQNVATKELEMDREFESGITLPGKPEKITRVASVVCN